ncbi:MAG: hypothetical protein H6978_02390 [Gammaproteobacteria bacterium]|nr:hypothetical protein [Gammaproteobacteria bacterium]
MTTAVRKSNTTASSSAAPVVADGAPAREDRVEALEHELELYRRWTAEFIRVCKRGRAGDFEARVLLCDERPELRELADSINDLLDVTDAFVREAGAALISAAHGRFSRRVVLRGMNGAFRSASTLINQASTQMAAQDSAIKGARQERVGLANEFENEVMGMVNTVASAATEMRATAETLASAARMTSDQAAVVADVSDRTRGNVHSATEATDNLVRAVGDVETEVGTSARAAERAVDEAGETNAIIAGLVQDSERIGGVVKLISQVAEQTNLLALNAAIEAARAGEAGKGFAVVASEVKSLAQQTATATEDITARIEAIQDTTHKAVAAITRIGGSIENMRDRAHGIAETVSQQKQAANQIRNEMDAVERAAEEVGKSIAGVTETAQETNDSAGQVLVAADELSRLAESLRGEVDKFVGHVRG